MNMKDQKRKSTQIHITNIEGQPTKTRKDIHRNAAYWLDFDYCC